MFVNVISVVTVICLCTSYDLLLGCATSWESFHAYFLYMNFYAISPILLTYIHNSGLLYLCLNYLPHTLKHISLILVSQYLIYLFLLQSFSIVSYFQGSSSLAISNTLIPTYNIIFTLPLSKYPVFMFHLSPHAAPTRDTDNKEQCFYVSSVRSRGCLHCYRLQRQGLKPPALSMMPTMQRLVEYMMYVSQGDIPM